MSKFAAAGAGLLVCALLWPALGQSASAPAQPIPIFATDDRTSWFPDRPMGDDFLPPASGPGPVLADPKHPYTPNDEGRNTGVQPTYRIADLSNPILQPWAREQMKKANDEVLAGGVPFVARERCWPAGVPAFDIMRRVAPVWVVQSPKEVLLVWPSDQQVRHVYMNVPHTKAPKPSWYGESVGRYEGDELVVDTIGLSDKSFVDNYRTPHTTRMHVVERFRLVDAGKTLQINIEVEDPGTFTMKWQAMQRFKRWTEGPMAPSACAENNFDYFTYKVEPIPQAAKPDF
jgi:hypothetical protein